MFIGRVYSLTMLYVPCPFCFWLLASMSHGLPVLMIYHSFNLNQRRIISESTYLNSPNQLVTAKLFKSGAPIDSHRVFVDHSITVSHDRNHDLELRADLESNGSSGISNQSKNSMISWCSKCALLSLFTLNHPLRPTLKCSRRYAIPTRS